MKTTHSEADKLLGNGRTRATAADDGDRKITDDTLNVSPKSSDLPIERARKCLAYSAVLAS